MAISLIVSLTISIHFIFLHGRHLHINFVYLYYDVVLYMVWVLYVLNVLGQPCKILHLCIVVLLQKQ